MLVTSSLANLPVARGQRGPIVVDHQAIQLITGTLLADVVAAQLPELGQLLVRQLNWRLEHDPDDRLEEGRCGQRAQVRPVGLGVGKQAARIQATRDRHAIVLVRHKLQQLHNLIEALVVFTALEGMERQGR